MFTYGSAMTKWWFDFVGLTFNIKLQVVIFVLTYVSAITKRSLFVFTCDSAKTKRSSFVFTYDSAMTKRSFRV